ncbi:hypothetical protein JW935_14300 [candidate division KSB1 bacterium]|nr:hypothetical protein [candidate division KSB1 bacterium]
MTPLLLLFLALTQAPHGPEWQLRVVRPKSPHAVKNIDWTKEIIYFILIDRFCNGDSTNDAGNNPDSHMAFTGDNPLALKSYQGGDLQGVLNKLDYLQDLGITAIWLSPVFDNSNEDFNGWWPYHGYSPVDFFNVDEHFGDMALLQELIRRAHQRDIKVILDMIYNHAAPDHPWIFEKSQWRDAGFIHWFHPHSGVDASTSIDNWQDQKQLENRELNGLPDFDQNNPNVYDFLLDMSKYWIVQTNCDGFRLDAVKHIPKPFWQKICRDLHDFAGEDFLLLGEVFSGEVPYVAGYADLGFNALFDIPMYYTVKRVFAQGSRANLLSEQLAQNQLFENRLLSPLLDNHDVARFSYWCGENVLEKTKLAVAFVLTLNGLPMIYYGTEAALQGAAAENKQTGEGQDYLNRRFLPWEKLTQPDSSLVDHIRRLCRFRQNSRALQNGRPVEIYKDYGVYAFCKVDSNEAILAVFNTSSEQERRKFFLRGGIFSPSGSMVDILTDKKYDFRADTLDILLPPRQALILSYCGTPVSVINLPAWRCPFTEKLTVDFKMVQFYYKNTENVTEVAVAGDFNGWSAEKDKLHQGPDGIWRLKLPMRKGRYRYKFVLNKNKWIADPNADLYELDPYGGKNSVIHINQD